MERKPDSNLCLQCSKVDFQALAQPLIKVYPLESLASMARNPDCPLCRLVLSVVSNQWGQWAEEIWKPDMSPNINFWLKGTLWAHCSDGPDHDVDDPPVGRYERMHRMRLKYLRYRAALGSNWTPNHNIFRSSDRFTICELDLVPGAEGFETFPLNSHTDGRQILKRRFIPPTVDVSLVGSWIQQCKTQHRHSTGRGIQDELRKTLRFRLVDVENRTLVQPQEHVDYVALSYVWGDIFRGRSASERSQWLDSLVERVGDDNPTTTPRRHLCFEKLPATIQDALTLVKLVGWKYLWIDLVCIQQNDKADKQALIGNMHLIYEGASCTIVAAGGSDTEARLHGLHHAPRRPESVCEIETSNGPLSIAPSRPTLESLLSSTVWSTRGWTFQEFLLSPCCLYFTPSEVFYSCQHHIPLFRLPRIDDCLGFGKGRQSEWRESYTLETRSINTAYCTMSDWNNGSSRRPTQSVQSGASVILGLVIDDTDRDSTAPYAFSGDNRKRFYEYIVFVAEYTKRQLSNTDDAVAAFMGILGKFGIPRYLDTDLESHGLLDTHLEWSLLWMADKDTPFLRRRIMADTSRPQFPSWAWAGWVGAVTYPIKKLHYRYSNDTGLFFSPRK